MMQTQVDANVRNTAGASGISKQQTQRILALFFQVDHPNQPTVWLEIEKGEEKWGSKMNAFLKFFSEALLVLPAGDTSDLLMIKLSWILIFSS